MNNYYDIEIKYNGDTDPIRTYHKLNLNDKELSLLGKFLDYLDFKMLTKESVLEQLNDDELFSLVHTIKEYLIPKIQNHNNTLMVLDKDLGKIIKELKK